LLISKDTTCFMDKKTHCLVIWGIAYTRDK